jgi:hypothetical protein
MVLLISVLSACSSLALDACSVSFNAQRIVLCLALCIFSNLAPGAYSILALDRRLFNFISPAALGAYSNLPFLQF